MGLKWFLNNKKGERDHRVGRAFVTFHPKNWQDFDNLGNRDEEGMDKNVGMGKKHTQRKSDLVFNDWVTFVKAFLIKKLMV